MGQGAGAGRKVVVLALLRLVFQRSKWSQKKAPSVNIIRKGTGLKNKSF